MSCVYIYIYNILMLCVYIYILQIVTVDLERGAEFKGLYTIKSLTEIKKAIRNLDFNFFNP